MISVFCVKCKADLGWMYEYTKNDEQRYKEGKYVLETECLRSVMGVAPVPPAINAEQAWRPDPRNRENNSDSTDSGEESELQIHLDL
jgi:hypothetical protein